MVLEPGQHAIRVDYSQVSARQLQKVIGALLCCRCLPKQQMLTDHVVHLLRT